MTRAIFFRLFSKLGEKNTGLRSGPKGFQGTGHLSNRDQSREKSFLKAVAGRAEKPAGWASVARRPNYRRLVRNQKGFRTFQEIGEWLPRKIGDAVGKAILK